MIVIDRNAFRIQELAWFVAILAELGHERAAIIITTREYLHSVIEAIDDEQETSMMVECYTKRSEELAISIALVLGADRELDSSITIKKIVSHVSDVHYDDKAVERGASGGRWARAEAATQQGRVCVAGSCRSASLSAAAASSSTSPTSWRQHPARRHRRPSRVPPHLLPSYHSSVS